MRWVWRFPRLWMSNHLHRCVAELTLEESHRPVEALRAELVVPETTQQLRDHDVCLLGHMDASHVSVDDIHSVVPFDRLALLQSATLVLKTVECAPAAVVTYVVKALIFLSTA